MSQAMTDLADCQQPSLSQLLALSGEWPSATPGERLEFLERRKALVRRLAGTYYKSGREITTSGYSTGATKAYRWGPAFQGMFDFTEHSRNAPFGFDRRAMLRVHPDVPTVYSGVFEGQQLVIVNSRNLEQTFVEAAGMFPEGRTCWRLLPTYGQFLTEHCPELFDLFDPAKHVFESTGEPSSRKLRQFFRDRGLLYLDCMRSWMGGVTFITCPHGNQHFLDFVSEISTELVEDGLVEIVTTDLWNLAQPFINFPTGDVVDWMRRETCACGYPIDDFEFRPRSPVLVVKGRPLRFVDLAAEIGVQCKKLLGLEKICVSFCLDEDTMFVDLLVSGDLRQTDAGPLEREFGDYLGLRCVVVERVSATPYKVLAIRQSGSA